MPLDNLQQPQKKSPFQGILEADFDRFRFSEFPQPLADYILDRYGIDLRGCYGDQPVRLIIGKASGQLSMEPHQVQADADGGLGFCVLKTVIAEDPHGRQTMKAWAIPVTRMKVEKITGKSGQEGWTVTWIGRGWHKSFASYLSFFSRALAIGADAGMLVVPSFKAHLPASDDDPWKRSEYDHCVGELLKVWRQFHPNQPMPVEFDFSPTLAGSGLAQDKARILDWLATVPSLIKDAARRALDSPPEKTLRVGIKVFNSLFDDDFQVTMVEMLMKNAGKEKGPDFIVYANRLFNPQREYQGVRGVAYGGPDLSDRNLRVLRRLCQDHRRGLFPHWVPISATGNIVSGTIAYHYLKAGATSLQIHTFFQVPLSCYPRKVGSRIERALHSLLFSPQDGLLRYLLLEKEERGVAQLSAQEVSDTG